MGSPASEESRYEDECQHEVTVGSFSIGKYEVTQVQWKTIMGNNPSKFKGCDDCPVENVSWDDVQEFIKSLNKKTGKNYRLPIEAEWEFAARGGKKSKGHKYAGAGSLGLRNVGWFSENSSSKTHTVGGKSPNELALHDMSGNVWEWCQDTWKPYPGCTGTVNGTQGVARGGGWFYEARYCRAAIRSPWPPGHRGNYLGFRLAL